MLAVKMVLFVLAGIFGLWAVFIFVLAGSGGADEAQRGMREAVVSAVMALIMLTGGCLL